MRFRPRPTITLILLFLIIGGATALGIRAYLERKTSGKRAPHIALYVLKNGLVLIRSGP